MGYGSMLIVQNMGSMFFLMILYVFMVAILTALKPKAEKVLFKSKVGKIIHKVVFSWTEGACWNTPISFLYESYFILCVMSFIGIQAL